jgi:predicted secreted protein
MKKCWPLLISVLALLLQAGCIGGEIKTYTASDKTMVKVNQEFMIILGANPSTGYDWVASYDETMVKLVSQTYQPNDTRQGQIVGAGGMDTLRFKALKAGEAEITLDYKRSGDEQPADHRVSKVTITK